MVQSARTPIDALRIVAANVASAEDLELVFGTRGEPGTCQCQWFKAPGRRFSSFTPEERVVRLREQTACGNPDAAQTSGLVAYLDAEPVGWCAVEPRISYPRLLTSRVPWTGRDEDKNDPDVWVVSCFVTRSGFRHRGISRALAAASVDFARERGASALEGYPMQLPEGKEATWGEMFVGARSVFADAGFIEITHPTLRRFVMRINFEPGC